MNLRAVLVPIPRPVAQAIAHFEAAVRANENQADAHDNPSAAPSNLSGRLPEALEHLETGLRLKPDPEWPPEVERLRAGRK